MQSFFAACVLASTVLGCVLQTENVEVVWTINSPTGSATCDEVGATQVVLVFEKDQSVFQSTYACSNEMAVVPLERGTYTATATLERVDGTVLATATLPKLVVDDQVDIEPMTFDLHAS
jgi:disulfide bond formation protein DsbB